jgi:hypothetical protein
MMKSLVRALACFLVLCLPACSSDDPAGPDVASDADIERIVDEAGYLAPLDSEKDVISDSWDEDEGDYRYTYETHDVVDNLESVLYLGLNDDLIWPGSLIKGDWAHFFVYEPISLPRAPMTLSIFLETSTTGESIVQVIADPKLSTVRQGIADLLKSAIVEGTAVPAKVEFSYEQVYNESHMSMYLGADVSYGLGSLDTAFDWQSTTRKTKIVAKYKRIYYSIDMDTPASPADVFPHGLSERELKNAMPRGSMPLCVAGVSYGVMAVTTIETDFKEEEMNFALDAAYQGIVDVELETGFTARQMMQSNNIRIVVYGGSTLGLQDIEEGFNGFMKIVAASTQFSSTSPGVPLVYKFRHLSDNTLALVTMTSQYTLVRPLKLRQRVRITANSFQREMSDDEGLGNDVDMDIFELKAWAYQRNSEEGEAVPIIEDRSVYYWAGAPVTTPRGYVWQCGEPHSIEVVFDNEDYDFDSAQIRLWGHARDQDTTSNDENGYGDLWLLGRNFFENGGVHSFLLNTPDFRYKVYATLEMVN